MTFQPQHSYDVLLKFMLIGDSGVGKTCIMGKFSDDAFDITYIPTIGIDFKIKTIEINGKRIKLQLWDTAGQERFNTLTCGYYRGAHGIMLVYDITNPQSFENLERWLWRIDEHSSENVVKMIVGNKSDLKEKRKISWSRGHQMAKEREMSFIETSAKQNFNIDTAFFDFTKEVLSKNELSLKSPRETVKTECLEEQRNFSCC